MLSRTILHEFERRIYRDRQGPALPYRFLMPEAYDAGKRYPLVLFLHGAGEKGGDNSRQVANGVERFAVPGNRRQYPCFVAVPQCPANSWWADAHGEPSPALVSAFELLGSLAGEFSIDDDRWYITGISMGGFGTWAAIETWPQYFAAAVPVCGGGDPGRARRIIRIPVWAFHGAEDNIVDVGYSREMIEAMRRAGGSPKYTEYPGVGHNSWDDAYADPEMYAWLFRQRKNGGQEGE